MKAKINIKNILYYLQGNFRYKLFYSKFNFFIRKHIKEQIDVRIKSMRDTCYNNGVCDMCGCQTTALQMCDKACEGFCYPKMLSKRQWNLLKNNKVIVSDNKKWGLNKNKTKFKKYEI